MSCKTGTENKKLRTMLSGVFAPISTPFLPTEEIDYEALRFNIRYYAQTEIKGYLALGSNGENKSLSEDEKLRVLETISQCKGKGQIIMAGATYEAQRDTERFLRDAASLGAHFGLVLPPSYFRKQMTDDVLYRYYASLAERSPLPLLIYNAPGFCGITLSPELVRRLSEVPGIIGMKDSASSGIENFLAFASDEFHVLAGSANFLFPAMMKNAVGGTVSLANIFPQLAVELYRCGEKKDTVNGIPLQQRITRINSAISGKYGVSGVKAAMNLRGLIGGIPRRPLLALGEPDVSELKCYLAKEGLVANG